MKHLKTIRKRATRTRLVRQVERPKVLVMPKLFTKRKEMTDVGRTDGND
jgi:hypothetical protein